MTVSILLILYFLPAIIASLRGHHLKINIACINFAFGWTIIGWVIALIVALTDPRREVVAWRAFMKRSQEEHEQGLRQELRRRWKAGEFDK